jgi:hypothetical protein
LVNLHNYYIHNLGYELGKGAPVESKPPFVIAREFGPEGMLRLHGKLLTQTFENPLPAYFWVSGFAFSKSNVIVEVAFCPRIGTNNRFRMILTFLSYSLEKKRL